MSIASKPAVIATIFPLKAVMDCLRDELLLAVKAQAHRKGKVLPPTDSAIVAMPMQVDSLSVVETLCALDDLLPFQVDESVVRAGGYGSINEAVEQVSKKIEVKWKKYQSGEKT